MTNLHTLNRRLDRLDSARPIADRRVIRMVREEGETGCLTGKPQGIEPRSRRHTFTRVHRWARSNASSIEPVEFTPRAKRPNRLARLRRRSLANGL